jgi:hypothetical protein
MKRVFYPALSPSVVGLVFRKRDAVYISLGFAF